MNTPQLRKELRDAAETAAQSGNFREAINLCDQVLAICDEADEDKLLVSMVLNHRANSNFELLRTECALEDSKAAIRCLEEVPDTADSIENRRLAFFTAGRAAYSMGIFIKAQVYFQTAHDIQPSGATVRMLRNVEARLGEEKTGSFDFEKMLERLIKNPEEPRLNHASFITNTDIRDTAAYGRGLFAAKDFLLGDLVLCEKAFAIVFEEKNSLGQSGELESQVVEMLKYSPAAKAVFYTLTDGEGAPPPYPGQYLNSAQIRTMASLNAFAFAAISTRHGAEEEGLTGCQNREGTSALYIRASLFNHSCVANVKRAHIGDMMIVRAMRPIKKGEELFISYIDTSVEFQERGKILRNLWLFECSCKRCQADETLTVDQQNHRERLVEEAEAFIGAAYAEYKTVEPQDVKEAERLMQQLRLTYTNPAYQGLPHSPLIDLGRFLAENYLLKDLIKAEETLVRLFEDLGFAREDEKEGIVLDLAGARDMPDYSTGAALLAARMLHSKKMRVHKDIFVDLSRELYRTWYGTVFGFEDFADPYETGWLDDLSASYM